MAGGMVADRKVWPDARTGAKGQHQRMAGPGPDWPALTGTGTGADVIRMARSSDNSPAIYGWVIVQPINEVPAGTKESPVLAKDSAVPGRDLDGGRAQAPQP